MGFWDDADIISIYTREQAVEDGFLVDVSELMKEAGLPIITDLTRTVWNKIEDIPASKSWQDVEGRCWDVVWMAQLAFRGYCRRNIDQVVELPVYIYYKLIMHVGRCTYITLKITLNKDHKGNDTLTISLPEED